MDNSTVRTDKDGIAQNPQNHSEDKEINNQQILEHPWKSSLKLLTATLLLISSITSFLHSSSTLSETAHTSPQSPSWRRRLSILSDPGSSVPTYMNHLVEDLAARKKLFDETPPEEVKYWFEYTGPLQKYFYRYSKERQKADSFEGRDDSGVVSARFTSPGGGSAYESFFTSPEKSIPTSELPAHFRLLDNCFALGNERRPHLEKGGIWDSFFGGVEVGKSNSFGKTKSTRDEAVLDRCRILVTMDTVGAGRGSTILWETSPPQIHASGPTPWMSEQETAAMHLERNLKELDSMCETGLIAIRLQVLVCEPIPGVWTDWMDSMLSNCGGRPAPLTRTAAEGGEEESPYEQGMDVEERPSPVQVVVVANAGTADSCHDLKSGFMEKRMQDLILAPPYLSSEKSTNESTKFDPSVKTTHKDLVSSDDHDMYIALKWSSLISIRAVSAFAQASADLAAAAASPNNKEVAKAEINADGVTVGLNRGPASPFLIPSFVRMSYVSEENNKVAKWRMHGDFFHPAAWEICKDSFDVTWIPDSLSGNGGVHGMCYEDGPNLTQMKQRFDSDGDCGQWWIYLAEEQMPTNPEVHANEANAPLIQGGSNFIWMLTERHRREIVTQKVCEHNAKGNKKEIAMCGETPQAIIPLGDMESFLINFTPNTALGKKHVLGRKPGYSKEAERRHDRDLVRERKQLKGQEDIEKALFDYTVYPAALFRKDATLKAARSRDFILTKKEDVVKDSVGPQTVKSSYYDVTITKPRGPLLGWCQAIARNGMCSLYAEYFRQSSDMRCMEACGLKKNWTKIAVTQS